MRQGKTYKPPNERWRGSGKLLRRFRIVLILTIALFVISCSTTRKTRMEEISSERVKTEERHDTMASLVRQIVKETVPMSRVEMEIAMDSLRNLPEGASYQKRSGQVNASVTTQGNKVKVVATCDSLQREVEYYAELYFSALKELEEMHESALEAKAEEKECRHTPLLTTILALTAGIIAGSTATLIIKTARNG